MAYRHVASAVALLFLASCGSATIENPSGSAGAGGSGGSGGSAGAGGKSGTGGTAGATGRGGGAGGTAAGGSGGAAGAGTGGSGSAGSGGSAVSGAGGTAGGAGGTAGGAGGTAGGAGGACAHATDGTACSDGDMCTRVDTCQSGVCVGSGPVSCGNPTTCHTQGSCDSTTGLCSTPTAPDNTLCNTALYGSCHSGNCGCYGGASPISCGGGPSCMNWGFESNTIEGWGIDPQNGTDGVTGVTVSSARSHSGAHSLAVAIAIAKYAQDGSRGFSIAVPLCPGGTVSLANYTVSFWVNFTVSQGTMPMNAANLIAPYFEVFDSSSENGTNTYIPVSNATTNQWLHFQATINESDPLNNYAVVSVGFPIADPTTEGFTGTMYLDDFQLTPP